MLRKLRRVIPGLWLLLTAGMAQTAPILNVDVNGKLTGARNVDVGGILYDVEFRNGTCLTLYSGCNIPNFPFPTEAGANAASAALLAQVFLDGALGLFDSHAELIFGCQLRIVCSVFTPYGKLTPLLALISTAANDPDPALDAVQSGGIVVTSFDTGDRVADVYAVWERIAVVPEPPTYACVLLAAGIALAMSGWGNRKRVGQQLRL